MAVNLGRKGLEGFEVRGRAKGVVPLISLGGLVSGGAADKRHWCGGGRGCSGGCGVGVSGCVSWGAGGSQMYGA